MKDGQMVVHAASFTQSPVMSRLSPAIKRSSRSGATSRRMFVTNIETTDRAAVERHFHEGDELSTHAPVGAEHNLIMDMSEAAKTVRLSLWP
jgi:hypothetical protein